MILRLRNHFSNDQTRSEPVRDWRSQRQSRTGSERESLGVIHTNSFFPRLVATLLVVSILATFLLLLFFRRVNLDEGWYLGAAQRVYDGRLLYHDFAYTQTPLLPYVYGLLEPLLGLGLYQGRLLTISLGLLAWCLSVVSAFRLGGERAAFYCLALLATSFFAATQYTYTATYALTACLIAAAIDVSLRDWPTRRQTIIATGLISLAVTVRLSAIVVLPPFLLYLVLRSREWRATLLWGLSTTAVTLGLLLGGYWWLSGDLMIYDIWGFHLDRILRTKWRVEKIRLRTIKSAIDFAVPILLGGWATIWVMWRLGRQGWATIKPSALLVATALMVCAVALFVAHIVPRTTDSYYNSLQVPMLCTAGSVVLALLHQQLQRRLTYSLVIGLLLLNGVTQGYATWRDGALPFPFQNQIAVVRQAAQIIARYTQPDATLLSFNQHLALEANRPTPPGYEMAIFSYRPTWSAEQARAYKAINNDLLFADLAAGQGAVAFTEFDLGQIYGERDRFFALLAEHYRWWYTIENFGPYGDVLHLYFPPHFQPPQPQTQQEQRLGDGISLFGYDLIEEEQAGADVVKVGLYWHSDQEPNADYTVFLQLLDDNGALVWGWDNPPCRRTCPTESWRPGEYLRDEYTVPLDTLTTGATYTLVTGMYNLATGQRLPLLSASGEVVGDHITLTALVR